MEKAAGGRFFPPHVPPQKSEPKANDFWIGGAKALLLARQEGLEPPTYCLEGSCSIQLSYWRISPVPKSKPSAAGSIWRGGTTKHSRRNGGAEGCRRF